MADRPKNSNPKLDFESLKQTFVDNSDSGEIAEFSANAKAFRIGQMIKSLRLEQKLTQQQLAERIGTQKSYISKIEKGADLQVSTMFRIFEKGLGVSLHLLTGKILI